MQAWKKLLAIVLLQLKGAVVIILAALACTPLQAMDKEIKDRDAHTKKLSVLTLDDKKPTKDPLAPQQEKDAFEWQNDKHFESIVKIFEGLADRELTSIIQRLIVVISSEHDFFNRTFKNVISIEKRRIFEWMNESVLTRGNYLDECAQQQCGDDSSTESDDDAPLTRMYIKGYEQGGDSEENSDESSSSSNEDQRGIHNYDYDWFSFDNYDEEREEKAFESWQIVKLERMLGIEVDSIEKFTQETIHMEAIKRFLEEYTHGGGNMRYSWLLNDTIEGTLSASEDFASLVYKKMGIPEDLIANIFGGLWFQYDWEEFRIDEPQFLQKTYIKTLKSLQEGSVETSVRENLLERIRSLFTFNHYDFESPLKDIRTRYKQYNERNNWLGALIEWSVYSTYRKVFKNPAKRSKLNTVREFKPEEEAEVVQTKETDSAEVVVPTKKATAMKKVAAPKKTSSAKKGASSKVTTSKKVASAEEAASTKKIAPSKKAVSAKNSVSSKVTASKKAAPSKEASSSKKSAPHAEGPILPIVSTFNREKYLTSRLKEAYDRASEMYTKVYPHPNTRRIVYGPPRPNRAQLDIEKTLGYLKGVGRFLEPYRTRGAENVFVPQLYFIVSLKPNQNSHTDDYQFLEVPLNFAGLPRQPLTRANTDGVFAGVSESDYFKQVKADVVAGRVLQGKQKEEAEKDITALIQNLGLCNPNLVHSERGIMQALRKRENLEQICNDFANLLKLSSGNGIYMVYGAVMLAYSTNTVCPNCTPTLIALQNSHEPDGFLYLLTQCLNTMKGPVKFKTAGSDSKTGKMDWSQFRLNTFVTASINFDPEGHDLAEEGQHSHGQVKKAPVTHNPHAKLFFPNDEIDISKPVFLGEKTPDPYQRFFYEFVGKDMHMLPTTEKNPYLVENELKYPGAIFSSGSDSWGAGVNTII